jgi:DMSO reductase family type II enzyme molybdopterin subunit
MTEDLSLRYSAKSTEDHYRARFCFDRVAWGSHCVDCYPGGCPYHLYIKDSEVLWEEVPGVFLDLEVSDRKRSSPDSYPMGCNKGASWSQQAKSKDRILYPMRRVGARGSGQWQRISWQEALSEAAKAIVDAIEKYGPETIFKEGTPEVGAGLMAADKFLGLLGGTITDLNGSINDFAPGHHLTFGKFYPILGDGELFNSQVMILWNTNPVYTLIPIYHSITEARYKGCEIILLSPDVSPSAMHVDYHIPLSWGCDPAFLLSACQVILEEHLVDEDFVRNQTDLALLIRNDNNMFLRESDLKVGGSNDQFYHLDSAGNLIEASRTNLLNSYKAELYNERAVELVDGSRVRVRPLMARLKKNLNSFYKPDDVKDKVKLSPDVIRSFARKVASKRTRVIMGMGANKVYHADLFQRSMNLLLGITGNWGKKGAGINCWAATQIDGQLITGGKRSPGVQGAEEVLTAMIDAREVYKQKDPSLNDELATIELARDIGSGVRSMVPPVFFWYWHCGFKSRWNNPVFNDSNMPRSFDDYFNEALSSNWWGSVARPGPDRPPRVLIECGGNILRRTRGGRGIILNNLWPKLEKIITIDVRMSATALNSDLLLPAAQHYEKVGLHIPILALILSDKAVEPMGESRPEWEIFSDLLLVIQEVAKERELIEFKTASGELKRYDQLWNEYTLNGVFNSNERVFDEIIRDSAYAGVIPEGTDLKQVRKKGFVRFTKWGRTPMAVGQAAPWPEANEGFSAFSYHVERGDPYPTLTRRAQFLIEHPWFREAGEDLPVHKDAPKMGGDYPFKMTTGHNRWSIHAMNTGNHILLQTHRGSPHAVINTKDARSKGISDNSLMRIFNDVGSFLIPAKISPAQRPGGVTVYNGWDPNMFSYWTGPNEVEPGMVKYLGLAGGYGHLKYAPLEWQPVPTDRPILVDIEAVK